MLIPFATCLVLLFQAGQAGQEGRVFSFTREDEGKVPQGWEIGQTGQGKGSVWKVAADPTGPGGTGYVLAQTAKGPSGLFNLCTVSGMKLKDLELSAAFKANEGQTDQGGGLVWRFQDANNYYIARYNPLEDNFRLYHVAGGKRTQIAGKEDVKLAAGWHTMTVKMFGERIECRLDGKEYLTAADRTITPAGRVGLWTKADAQTSFDAVKVVKVSEVE